MRQEAGEFIFSNVCKCTVARVYLEKLRGTGEVPASPNLVDQLGQKVNLGASITKLGSLDILGMFQF